jgi:hypothetical protein
VIETLQNRADFRPLTEEKQIYNKIFSQNKRVGVTTIATVISVRWYSFAKMISNAIQLRSVIESYLATSRDAALKKKLMKTYDAELAEMSEEIPSAQPAQRIAISAPSTQHELDDDEIPPMASLEMRWLSIPAQLLKLVSASTSRNGKLHRGQIQPSNHSEP